MNGDDPKRFMFRCPNGHVGRIDREQAVGDVSIICRECEFHGYADEGEVVRTYE